ncbi:hypothetical protein GEV29_10640 [Aeromicrobium sp. SMF47]|uniref:hypothetical protein n=1 Tax=Aeromicrobium yanjiei TaxID=2662028 RepID=UPI00129E3010|nr:hypothetical protein [Aeromicrobium yanjiei]MRJ76997.1 hypothetical protein [Aeromicrobium yanjiei]
MISTSRKARAAALVLLLPTAVLQPVLFAPGAAQAQPAVTPEPSAPQPTSAPARRSLAVPMPEVRTLEALPIPQFRPGKPWQDELPPPVPRVAPAPDAGGPWRVHCTACTHARPTVLP